MDFHQDLIHYNVRKRESMPLLRIQRSNLDVGISHLAFIGIYFLLLYEIFYI